MTVYDAGVLVAADRDDRQVWADHKARLEAGALPTTTAPVVAQVSRTPRQVQLRRFLQGCHIVPFAVPAAHPVGLLLAAASTSDVVDAHVVIVASQTATTVVTGDPDDISHLAANVATPINVRTI
jgi:hypothetical protein